MDGFLFQNDLNNFKSDKNKCLFEVKKHLQILFQIVTHHSASSEYN